MIDVTIMTPKTVLFEDEVESAVFPGDKGDFEVLQFHKSLLSRLRPGQICLNDDEFIDVTAGVVRVYRDQVIALVEQ